MELGIWVWIKIGNLGEIGDGSEWLVTRVRCCVAVAVRVKRECECVCAWDTVRNER